MFAQDEKDKTYLENFGFTNIKIMKEDSFVDMLSKDVRDPMIRYYNEIKIKLVTEKHFFEIE